MGAKISSNKGRGEQQNTRYAGVTQASNVRVRSVDDDHVKLIASGSIGTAYTDSVPYNEYQSCDIQRCYFLNPADMTYLTVELGPYGYCNACLMKGYLNPQQVYRVPSPSDMGNNNKNRSDLTYTDWVESEVNQLGVPSGVLSWKGEAVIHTDYFPPNAILYHTETINSTDLYTQAARRITDLRQFTDCTQIIDNVTLGRGDNDYSPVWLSNLSRSISDKELP